MRRRPLRGRGRVRVRGELPLLELPRIHRIGIQAVRRPSAGAAPGHRGRRPPARLGRGGRESHALRRVRFAALFRRARRRVRPRRPGLARRRALGSPDEAHLRGLEGAVVRDHGRVAAASRVLKNGEDRRRLGRLGGVAAVEAERDARYDIEVAAAAEVEDLEIPYAIRWLVPKGERFANFDLLNDNDTQLDYYRRFGHVYAVGIPTKKWRLVVVSDPELLDEVAANEEQFGKRTEELNFFEQLANTRGGGISVIGDGEHYERVRRVMLPWYSPQHQRTQLVRMKEQARKLVTAWAQLPDDEPIDAREWMERYTLEVSGRGACNYDFGLLGTNGECPHAFAEAVPQSTKESILRVAEPRPDAAWWRKKQRRY